MKKGRSPVPNNQTPFDFQLSGIEWLRAPRSNGKGFSAAPLHGILGDDMGMCKTATSLLALRPEIERGKRFLFIVPGNTTLQWQRTWDRWILDCENDEFGMDGLYALRASDAQIPRGLSCICSHQMIAKADFVLSVIRADFDGILIDEGHKFGSRDAKRAKHLFAIVNNSPSRVSTARLILTGTPVRNYADEIYNLWHFVSPDLQIAGSEATYSRFASKYLTRDEKALWNPPQFHDDFRPFYIRREATTTKIPHRKAKLYTEVTDKFIRDAYNKELDALDNFMSNGEKVDSMSLLGYLVKLRHITGIAKAKEPSILEPICEYLLSDSLRNEKGLDGEAAPYNKVAIGLIHRFVADRLELSIKKRIPDVAIFRVQGGLSPHEKDAAIQGFKSAKQPSVILVNMEAGGAGTDGLQEACSRSYVFERMWNGADELQFEKRINRTGQLFNTETDYTIATGTIDEFFDELVESKTNITGQVSDENWERDDKFIKQLAEKIVIGGHLRSFA